MSLYFQSSEIQNELLEAAQQEGVVSGVLWRGVSFIVEFDEQSASREVQIQKVHSRFGFGWQPRSALKASKLKKDQPRLWKHQNSKTGVDVDSCTICSGWGGLNTYRQWK